jgi:hypothetical protein
MARKVLKKDIARALGVSSSMITRHARRGMPTHSIELARAWCDANLHPALRKEARDTRLPPALVDPRFSPDELRELLEAAGEEIVACMVFNGVTDLERAQVAINCIGWALHVHLEARGIASLLWATVGPPLGDADDPSSEAARLRIEARIAALRVEYLDDETPGDDRSDHEH